MIYDWHHVAENAYARALGLVLLGSLLLFGGVGVQFGIIALMLDATFLQPYARLLLAVVPATLAAATVGGVLYRWFDASKAAIVGIVLFVGYAVVFFRFTVIWKI